MAATDWSDPERVKLLEARYTNPDIVEQRRRFIELAKPLAGERCLDIGCGPAFLVEQLQAAVGATGSVVGVDHSEAMLQGGRLRCPSATLCQASAEELPFPDCSFDLVTITQVLVYVSDPTKALSEAKRVLKLGGRVLVLDSIWSQSSWSGADIQRQRRILDEFDKHCAHPLLPMRIPQMLRAAGLQFAARQQHVIPITNVAWDDQGFGKGAASNITKYVTEQGLIDKQEVQQWVAELEESARSGTFFFNINRYVFVGTRSTEEEASREDEAVPTVDAAGLATASKRQRTD